MADEPIDLQRKAYLTKEVARAVVMFPKSDDITRKVVPVALRAIQMFDQLKYGKDEWQRFFEDGMVDETYRSLFFEALSQGVKEGTKWCNANHEPPKTCDCSELLKVVLGIVPATLPLGDLDGE